MPSSSPRHPAYSRYQLNYRNHQSPSTRRDNDGISEMEEVVVDKPILAINLKGKFLGGAFWRADDSTLILLGDIQYANPIDMLGLGFSFCFSTYCSETTNIPIGHSCPLRCRRVICEGSRTIVS